MEVNLAEGVEIDVQNIMTGRGCAIGQSGSGKSFLTGVIAEELCKAKMPFCVVDTEGEYSSLKSISNVIVVGGDNGDVGLDVDFSRLFSLSISNEVPVILDLSDEIEKKEIADKALRALYELENRIRRPYLVIIEEADKFAPQIITRKTVNIIEEISVRGRKRGIGLFITTQRPANISKNVLAQCSYGFVGKLTIENDLNALRMLFNSNEKLSRITRLETGRFVTFGLGKDMEFRVKARTAKHIGSTPSVSSYKQVDSKISGILKELRSGIPMQQQAKKNDGAKKIAPNTSIYTMPAVISEDQVKTYAETVKKKQFLVFGKTTEGIDSIVLQYMPFGLCDIRIPTKKSNEYYEYQCLINEEQDLAKLDNGIRILKYTDKEGAKKAYLIKEALQFEQINVSKENVIQGKLTAKRADIAVTTVFHDAILTEFKTVYLPVYRITLRNGNKVRVFLMDGIYGKMLELQKN